MRGFVIFEANGTYLFCIVCYDGIRIYLIAIIADLAPARFYLKNRCGIQRKLFPKGSPMNLPTLSQRILSFAQNALSITGLLLATVALVYWM